MLIKRFVAASLLAGIVASLTGCGLQKILKNLNIDLQCQGGGSPGPIRGKCQGRVGGGWEFGLSEVELPEMVMGAVDFSQSNVVIPTIGTGVLVTVTTSTGTIIQNTFGIVTSGKQARIANPNAVLTFIRSIPLSQIRNVQYTLQGLEFDYQQGTNTVTMDVVADTGSALVGSATYSTYRSQPITITPGPRGPG